METIEELSASKRKLIASLRTAKNRREAGLFVVEGTRCLSEINGTFRCRMVAARRRWFEEHGRVEGAECFVASAADLERMSSLSTAPDVMALYEIPQRETDLSHADRELVVALDGVQDPGNLGTIIRACDWFGVRQIFCSPTTVDVFNPKVIQSTMGALARVAVDYIDLEMLIRQTDVPVYGTFLDGKNIYDEAPPRRGIVVMGNEGNGITADIAKLVTHRIFIPPYPAEGSHVESLNVAMATAITLALFRRP